jgi:3-methyladenine DNA glycosylase/8-oxoguanine DNA glycosylase
VKTHILTINEKKEKKKEGCMEKRAKKFKIQKTLEFLIKKNEKRLPFRRLFHHTRTREEDAFIIARAHIITQQCHL